MGTDSPSSPSSQGSEKRSKTERIRDLEYEFVSRDDIDIYHPEAKFLEFSRRKDEFQDLVTESYFKDLLIKIVIKYHSSDIVDLILRNFPSLAQDNDFQMRFIIDFENLEHELREYYLLNLLRYYIPKLTYLQNEESFQNYLVNYILNSGNIRYINILTDNFKHLLALHQDEEIKFKIIDRWLSLISNDSNKKFSIYRYKLFDYKYKFLEKFKEAFIIRDLKRYQVKFAASIADEWGTFLLRKNSEGQYEFIAKDGLFNLLSEAELKSFVFRNPIFRFDKKAFFGNLKNYIDEVYSLFMINLELINSSIKESLRNETDYYKLIDNIKYFIENLNTSTAQKLTIVNAFFEALCEQESSNV